VSDDYRDLVITVLADENTLLEERVASLEADVDVYRSMCSLLLNTIALMKSNPAKASARERFVLHFARTVVLRGLEAECDPVTATSSEAA
jgi:hypothetical protein